MDELTNSEIVFHQQVLKDFQENVFRAVVDASEYALVIARQDNITKFWFEKKAEPQLEGSDWFKRESPPAGFSVCIACRTLHQDLNQHYRTEHHKRVTVLCSLASLTHEATSVPVAARAPFEEVYVELRPLLKKFVPELF